MNVDLSSIHLNCEVNGQTLPDRLDEDGHGSEHESLLITKREDGSSSKPSRRTPSAQSLPASSELTALSTQSIEKYGPEAVTPFETAHLTSRIPSAPPSSQSSAQTSTSISSPPVGPNASLHSKFSLSRNFLSAIGVRKTKTGPVTAIAASPYQFSISAVYARTEMEPSAMREPQRQSPNASADLSYSGSSLTSTDPSISHVRRNSSPLHPYQALVDCILEGPVDETTIRVAVRKRPLSATERSNKDTDIIEIQHPRNVVIHEPKKQLDLTPVTESHYFAFDHTFGAEVPNDRVYHTVCLPLVVSMFRGGKSTCFAYGQTGSGKTFAMMGDQGRERAGGGKGRKGHPTGEGWENAGLYALAARDIFQVLAHPAFASRGWTLHVSFFEIYGGKLFDLLNRRAPVRCLEDARQHVRFLGLTEKAVVSVEELLTTMAEGQSQRSTGSTAANADSSRSHAVLQLSLKGHACAERSAGRSPVTSGPEAKSMLQHGKRNVRVKDSNQGRLKEPVIGSFSFIDLAGSERGADTRNTEKATRMEGAEINTSLLALKEVIRALDRKQNHTPFRGSKLTQVLKDSLVGARAKTAMLACIAPALSSCEHTLNTLRYADRVKENDASAVPGPENLLAPIATPVTWNKDSRDTPAGGEHKPSSIGRSMLTSSLSNEEECVLAVSAETGGQGMRSGRNSENANLSATVNGIGNCRWPAVSASSLRKGQQLASLSRTTPGRYSERSCRGREEGGERCHLHGTHILPESSLPELPQIPNQQGTQTALRGQQPPLCPSPAVEAGDMQRYVEHLKQLRETVCVEREAQRWRRRQRRRQKGTEQGAETIPAEEEEDNGQEEGVTRRQAGKEEKAEKAAVYRTATHVLIGAHQSAHVQLLSLLREEVGLLQTAEGDRQDLILYLASTEKILEAQKAQAESLMAHVQRVKAARSELLEG